MKTCRKQIQIFFAITFLLPYVLGIFMGIGYYKGINLSAFPIAQMLYPAAGVILAILITRKEDKNIPKKFFISYLFFTILAILPALNTLLMPQMNWSLVSESILIIGSIVSGILLLTEKKKKKEAYGLQNKYIKTSLFVIVLFLSTYILRYIFSCLLFEEAAEMISSLNTFKTWTLLISMPVMLLITFLPFFGEEYGWRYYLQPILQNHFGARKGVILLGIIWGIWHLPINMFYYSIPSTAFISILIQIIVCITLGIFFAYAYMKTNNIWVPVSLHFLNNNLSLLCTGSQHNKEVSWEDLLTILITYGIIFIGFLFTKYFKEKQYLLPTLNKRADQAEADKSLTAIDPSNNQ